MSNIIRKTSLNIIKYYSIRSDRSNCLNKIRKYSVIQIQKELFQQSQNIVGNVNIAYNSYSTMKELQPNGLPPSFSVIYESMQMDALTLKRVRYSELCEAIKFLESNTISESELIFLLKCSGNLLLDKDMSTRAEIFEKIWSLAFKNKTFNHNHVQIMLEIYQQNKVDIPDAENFLRILPFAADIDLYENLLYTLCENGNVKEAIKVVEIIKKQQLRLTAKCYNALILGYSRAKNIKESERIMEIMSAANVEMGSDTYREYILGLIENNLLEKARKLIKEKGLLFNEQDVVTLLSSTNDVNLLNQIIALFPSDTLINPQVAPVIRNITTEALYAKKIENIVAIINTLPKPIFQLNEDSDTYSVYLIRDMFKTDTSIEEIIKICNFLMKSERNTRALHIACEISLKLNHPTSLALLKLLSTIEPPRPHYFWPLLISNFKTSGEIGMINTLKVMQELNCEVDYDTLSSYVLPKLTITIKNPIEAVKLLEENGVKMSKLITPLTAHLLCQKKISEVLSLNAVYPTRVNTSLLLYALVQTLMNSKSIQGIQTLAKLIKLLNEKAVDVNYDLGGHLLMEIVTHHRLKHDKKSIKSLLDEFNLIGVKISNVAADVVQQYFTNISEKSDPTADHNKYFKHIIDQKLSSTTAELITANIAHPRDMTLEELECHLVELQNKKLNTRGVLRRLLQMCVRAEKLERAVEIKKICDQEKVDLSPGMLASVFDLYIKTNSLPEAEETLEQLQKQFPGFLLDEHKIIDFCTLLIGNNELTKAKQILKQRATFGTVKGGQYILKNIWRLLNKLAILNVDNNLNSINKTKEFLDYLVKLGYCGYHNTLLGPVIRNYLIKNEIKLACSEYLKITTKYKKTPMQLELMKILIKIGNAMEDSVNEITASEARKLLEGIVLASSKVHGSANTNISLIIALAEEGTDKQLRKLLIDPKFRVNTENLLKQLQYLCGDISKIDTLLKLAKSCRGLGHLIQESELYNLILKTFIKENNCNAAVILYEKLMADDEYKINTEFLSNLISLFERNNLEIPTSVAIQAK